MLNVAILDLVEQLLVKSPPTSLANIAPISTLISGITSGLIFAGDSTVADSLAQSLANATFPVNPAPDFNRYWMGPAGVQKTILFDMTLETVVFDDSGARGFVQVITDNSGVVWAQAQINFGLWRRTSASTWTQVLTDTAISAGMRWRSSDNTYWYQSSSANWYQIANGVASLTAAPTGTLFQIGHVGWKNLLGTYLNAAAAMGTPFTFLGQNGLAAASPPVVPHDVYLNANRSNKSVFDTGNFQIRLTSTYTLLIGTSALAADATYYYCYLWNTTSNILRYIGSLPTLSVFNGVAAIAGNMKPFCGKFLASGGFRLYFFGTLANAGGPSVAGNVGGLAFMDVPYTPTF